MRILRTLVIGFSILLWPGLATAQDFPNKPIRLIVPFPAGGPNDIIARVVGQRMSELIRQPVLIDNRGGQAGVLGTDAVAKANPDGYTIGIVSASALAISPTMEKVAYDVARDFAPITLVATVPEMLVVTSNVPANNMAELVALVKAQPGKLNYASAGVGGLPHLAGELFKLTAKLDIVHVPYRGAAPAINDLLGQQVQMTFLDLPVLLPHIKSGTLRPIALGAPQRAPTAPDVPTTAEVGMPGLLIENWYGMIAPAKTPETIVAALNRIANEAMADPSVKQKLADQGLTLAGDTPEHFRGFIEAETKMGEGDKGRRGRDDEVKHVQSMSEAPAQFLKRDHDVILKCWAFLQRAIPALELRQLRPLDLQFEIPIQRRSGGNVGKRQRVSQQKRPALKQPVQLPEMPGTARQGGVDRRPVSFVRRASGKIPRIRLQGNPAATRFATSPSSRRSAREPADRLARTVPRHGARRDTGGWHAIPILSHHHPGSRAHGHGDSSQGKPAHRARRICHRRRYVRAQARARRSAT